MTDNDNGEVLQYNGNLSQEDHAIALWSDVVHHVARMSRAPRQRRGAAATAAATVGASRQPC
ncbi:hypothetical protein [Reyranella sp.]|uniref:hypothetical protein n=1 Tax=Reyranella sp. TaxID=1929291 RepID=UPI003783DD28